MTQRTLKRAAALLVLAIVPAWLFAATAAHARHFHFVNRLHASHSGARGYWPFFGGGIVAVPPYANLNPVSYVAPPTVVYVPLPPQALTCHRTRETVTVAAEAGGTRQITVTRC